MKINKALFLSVLFLLAPSAYGVKSLKEQVAQTYFSSRPLSAIKADLTHNKLNQELQEVLVPLVINKYKSQLDAQFCKTFEYHTDCMTITPFKISPNGKYALTGSYCDNIVYLLNLTSSDKSISWETTAQLEGHTDGISSIAFSSDSKHALTGSLDNTVRLWDLKTSQTINILRGHSLQITSVAFSPDNNYALTSSLDKTARIWDLHTGQTLYILYHADAVYSGAFSADGQYALTGSKYSEVMSLWDLSTGQTVNKFHNNNEPMALSHDNKYSVKVWADYTAHFCKLRTGKIIKTLEGHTEPIYSVAISKNSKLALTGSGDATARLWDLSTGQTSALLRHDHYSLPIALVGFSSDGKYALTALHAAHQVRLWHLDYCQNKIPLHELINALVN